MEAVDRSTGAADGADFGMGGWVVAGDNPVPALGNDLSLTHDHGAEGAALAEFAAFLRQFDGAGEEKIVLIHLALPVCVRIEMAKLGFWPDFAGFSDLSSGFSKHAGVFLTG